MFNKETQNKINIPTPHTHFAKQADLFVNAVAKLLFMQAQSFMNDSLKKKENTDINNVIKARKRKIGKNHVLQHADSGQFGTLFFEMKN